MKDQQGSLFSILRHTAHLPSSTSQLVLFHHLFCIHFWGGGQLPCSLPGGPTSVFTSGGGVHFRVHFWEGSTSMFTSGVGVHFWGVHFCVHFGGGVHVTYPIMLLYTAIEFLSASWVKFTCPPPQEFNRLTDRQTRLKTLPSRTLRMRAVIMSK